MEKYKDECEEYQKRLQLESRRREEVSRAGGRHIPMYIVVVPPKLGLIITAVVVVLVAPSVTSCRANNRHKYQQINSRGWIASYGPASKQPVRRRE